MSPRQKTSHRPNAHRLPPVPSPQGRSWNKTLWLIGSVLFVLTFFWVLRPIFALLAASAGIAYICDPIIDYFEERKFSRTAGIGIFSLIAFLLFLLFLLLLMPPIIVQMDRLSQDLTKLLVEVETSVAPLLVHINGITGWQLTLDFATIKTVAPQWLSDSSPDLQQKALAFVKGLFTQGLGLVNTLLNLTLLPVFTFYLLRDWDDIVRNIYDLIPPSFRPVVHKNMVEVDIRLNAFVRGQIKVCLALSFLYSVGLLIVGVDLAIPIGLISGILFVVPYLGTVFGILISSLLALINFGISWHIIGVWAVFGVSQLIEGYYLTPKIVGDSVGLSPLVVMISLLVGASLLGIWGMFLAIPVTAVLSVFATEWLERYRNSSLYTDEQ